MDDVDRAQLEQEREMERLIAAARGVPAIGRIVTECQRCGEEIAPARARLGYSTCIDCASRREDRLRMGVRA